MNNKITVRIYGLLIDDNRNVLVTDEIYMGQQLTKFPGGGLEKGEGTIDCLKREIKEELGQDAEVGAHFYTTDFYIQSVFHKDYQVICIYYFINISGKYSFEVKQKPFDFTTDKDGTVVFRWVTLDKINEEPFTFENDRIVAGMLHNKFYK